MAVIGSDMTGWNADAKDGQYARDTLGRPSGFASWFQAVPERGGVMMSRPDDPLGFVWQDPQQIREIIAKLQAALDDLERQPPTIPEA